MINLGTAVCHSIASHAVLAADLAGRYQLKRLVAQGGMGNVFEAERVRDQRRVAIKVLHPRLARDRRCRRLMAREAHALVAAAHPCVVELVEHGETRSGLPYLVLEWLPGRTLHQLIFDEAPLLAARIGRIFGSLLETLSEIHARGVVHADLKPENLMLVTGPDGRERLHLLDFGVSSVGHQHFAGAGEVCGTPGYLAPEILSGASPSASSDLYAAGIVLFELLTGRLPFRGSSPAALLLEQLYEPTPRPSAYWQAPAGSWDSVIARALAADRSMRFPDAASFHQDFMAAVAAAPRRTAPAHERATSLELPTLRWIGPRRPPLPTDARIPLSLHDTGCAISPQRAGMHTTQVSN